MAESLCERCRHVRQIVTPKGSRFLLCQLATIDAHYPKYPPQPVLRCEGFGARAGLNEEETDEG
jgi:hypothetical protein